MDTKSAVITGASRGLGGTLARFLAAQDYRRAPRVALLHALAGVGTVHTAYEAAVREGYPWHEFGDAHLIVTR